MGGGIGLSCWFKGRVGLSSGGVYVAGEEGEKCLRAVYSDWVVIGGILAEGR